MADTDNGVVRQRGQDAPHDELHKEAIHDGRRNEETFWRGKAGAQQPKQNPDRHEGDHTGNAMENGRYRCDWEPDRLQIQIDRSLFFTFLTMNNAHMLFLLFPSSGLLAGQTASFL